MNEDQAQNINIKAQDDDLKGYYANAMAMSHNREEFFMDFLLVHPPSGQLLTRIITSPGHIKRIYAAIKDQIEKYEDSFGPIKEADEPKNGGSIDFKLS